MYIYSIIYIMADEGPIMDLNNQVTNIRNVLMTLL